MFCPTCGKEIPDSAKFCPLCGESFANIQAEAPVAPEAQPVQPIQPVQPAQQIAESPVQPVQQAPAQAEAQPVAPQPQYIPQYEAPVTNAPAPEKKFDFSSIIKNKAVLIGAAAVVVVIILIILISVIGGSSGGSGSYDIVTTRYNTFSADDGIYVFYGDKQLEAIDSDGIDDQGVSVNASAMYIYTYDEELFTGELGRELAEQNCKRERHELGYE